MLISKSEIEGLKRRHELGAFVASTGVELKRKGVYLVGRCPFHDDRTPSLIVDPKKQLFNCLGACRGNGDAGGGKGKSGGDLFAFAMKVWGVDFREAFKRLGGEVKDELPPPRSRKAPSLPSGAGPALTVVGLSSRAPRTELFSRVVERLHGELAQSREAQCYLESRGLLTRALWSAFKLGFSSGCLEELAGEETPTRKLLVETGLLTEQGRERMKGRVVFPLTALNQLPVGLYGRAIASDVDPEHLFLPGPRRGLFNWNAARRSREILIVESVIDALSLIEAGVGNVVPIYGVNGVTEDHLELVRRFGVTSVLLALDADDAGREKTPEVAAAFEALGVTVRILQWSEKDPNELLLKVGPKKMRKIVETLMAPAAGAAVRGAISSGGGPCGPPIPPAPPLMAAPAQGEAIKEERPGVAAEQYELRFAFGPRLYQVRGARETFGKSATALRVRIKLFAGEANGGAGEAKVIDAVDLYSGRSRGAFLGHAVLAGAGERSEIERDLVKLAEALEALAEQERTAPVPTPLEMTPADRTEALAFLRRPDLLDVAAGDMGTLVYVGEETNKQIGYLVAVSRKLQEPLSVVIMSQSGSGKSALADVLETLTPPEDVILFSRLTSQALYYMDRDALARKFILIEERTGSMDADYSIRTLQSKKKLILAVPIKDPSTGRIKTQVFEILGPAAFLETTTESRIHHENSTRCFETYCDESQEQTRRIHEAQKRSKTVEGRRLLGEREAIVRRHHNAQRLLEPVGVVIPFVPLIWFPHGWLRTRRDHLRFLNLIETIAFLHQHQREKKLDGKGEPYVEATAADYERAYCLAGEVLGQALSDLKRPAAELLASVKALLAGKSDGTATRREIREATGLPDHRVIALLAELVALEYLEAVVGSQGKAFRYRLAAPASTAPKILAGLTTPSELRKKLSGLRSSRSSSKPDDFVKRDSKLPQRSHPTDPASVNPHPSPL